MTKEKDFKDIGLRIKEYRLERGLSQEKLGQKAHSSTASITAIERGIKTPRIDTLISIADALEVSADDLLKDVLEYPYSSIFTETQNVLEGCTPDAKKMLLLILQYMKDLFTEFGI